MTNPVAVWRKELDGPDGAVVGGVIWTWCPGCDLAHRFPIDSTFPDTRTAWEWDGNLERPSFSPSHLTWFKVWDEKHGQSEKRCHSYLKDGRWEFLADSTHELAGQTVDMVPLPDWLVASDAQS